MTVTDLARMALPNEKEVAAVIELLRQLAPLLSAQAETLRMRLHSEAEDSQIIEVPAFALRLFGELLCELALGNAVKVVPIHAELTSQEGADLLKMSRPHLVKLLDEGGIPHTKRGTHRRVRLADLVAYERKRIAASLEAIEALAAQSQELGLG